MPSGVEPATHQPTSAATSMMPPWARLSTPETPKMSVKPTAASAYSELMAKPSTRICSVVISPLPGYLTLVIVAGNPIFPFALSRGQTVTCLPLCHCRTTPVTKPGPYLIACVYRSSLP